jgi:hypothetical protein
MMKTTHVTLLSNLVPISSVVVSKNNIMTVDNNRSNLEISIKHLKYNSRSMFFSSNYDNSQSFYQTESSPLYNLRKKIRGHRGRMVHVVRFSTTYAISSYQH